LGLPTNKKWRDTECTLGRQVKDDKTETTTPISSVERKDDKFEITAPMLSFESTDDKIEHTTPFIETEFKDDKTEIEQPLIGRTTECKEGEGCETPRSATSLEAEARRDGRLCSIAPAAPWSSTSF